MLELSITVPTEVSSTPVTQVYNDPNAWYTLPHADQLDVDDRFYVKMHAVSRFDFLHV